MVRTSLSVALYLLIFGWVRHYSWAWFPVEARGAVSKGLGGVLVLALLPLVYRAHPSKPVLLALLWLAFESLQVSICSFAWAIQPWSVTPGEAICSSRIDFDLGALGILCVALILLHLRQAVSSGTANDESRG